MSPMSPGTFLLGLGAQKAGTSWLHSYLATYDGVDFGDYKEYHVWDGLTLPDLAEFDLRTRRASARMHFNRLRARLTGARPARFFLQQRMQRTPEVYFDYFSDRLTRGARLTGDVTPAYSGLSAETLTRIRQGFETRGVDVRAVFLMRDPVERCLSAMRMYTQRDGVSKQGVDVTASVDAALEAYAASAQGQLRTAYDATLAALEASFDPDMVHIGLYETMFEASEITRLSTRLGLTAKPEFAKERFNTTTPGETASEAARAKAAVAFAPAYEAAVTRFPEVRDLWPSARFVLK